MNLKDYIRSIPDYPKKGILFRDITTLIKNEKAFSETINQIVEILKNHNFDKIAAIESRGFVFASAISYLMKKPFILLRKKNKLPAERYSVDFELEYGTATIEMHKDSISTGEKVVIIDDLIATGGTAEAGAKIIAENLAQEGELNPMVPGQKVDAIYGFCDIRNFTDATECLQEDVMLFVNSVAGILHHAVAENGGSPNKNIGACNNIYQTRFLFKVNFIDK